MEQFWITGLTAIVLIMLVWLYQFERRMGDSVTHTNALHISVTKIESQISRFIEHEESEREARERENSRIHTELKGLRDHATQITTTLAVMLKDIERYTEDIKKREASWNSLVSSMTVRRGHDEQR